MKLINCSDANLSMIYTLAQNELRFIQETENYELVTEMSLVLLSTFAAVHLQIKTTCLPLCQSLPCLATQSIDCPSRQQGELRAVQSVRSDEWSRAASIKDRNSYKKWKEKNNMSCSYYPLCFHNRGFRDEVCVTTSEIHQVMTFPSDAALHRREMTQTSV